MDKKLKRVIDFGKIDFYGCGRRINKVTVDIKLTDEGGGKLCFSCSADVWNNIHTDIVCGGQCLNDIKPFFKGNDVFETISRLWENYHLNDMHAGTVAQEKCLADNAPSRCDYKEMCRILKNHNLLVDKGYKYGTGWLYRPIPKEDLKIIYTLLRQED